MRVVRIDGPEGPTYGQLLEDVVQMLAAPPYLRWEPTGEWRNLAEVKLLAPVTPSKVIGVGRNYLDHIQEMGFEVPDRPSVFLKPPTSVIGPSGVVVLPPTDVSDNVEHEAELAVVIGKQTRKVAPAHALDHVYGYTCANDVSARDIQLTDSSPIRAKGFDTFCPIGPWIETELDIGAGVGVRCRVGDELRQDGHTSQLVFDVPFLIGELSSVMTLLPGDVILTGTPGGCSAMHPGDTITIEIDGIGELMHLVAGSDGLADPVKASAAT